MTRLLVSVRDAAEALAALEGGAHLIDIKEPGRGAMGRADDAVVRGVIEAVAGRAPVSAARGELADAPAEGDTGGLTYRKWGLARSAGFDWPLAWARLGAGAGGVPVAYADAARAGAADAEEVGAWCAASGQPLLLLDTFVKDGLGLLHWWTVPQLWEWVARMRVRGVAVALAGSLTLDEVRLLAEEVRPAWVGVRTAACVPPRRDGVVTAERVAELRAALGPG